MTTAVPTFAGRYLKDVKSLPIDSGRRSPKEHTLADFLVAAMCKAAGKPVPTWVETVTFIGGKRQGLATWTNTKSGVEVKVLFKDDMVQSLTYHVKCKHCGDCPEVIKTYTRGVLSGTSRSSCDCDYDDELSSSCGCGADSNCGRCLTKAAESQWNYSYSPDPYSRAYDCGGLGCGFRSYL